MNILKQKKNLFPEEILSLLHVETDDEYETQNSSSEASNIDNEDLSDSEETYNLDSSIALPSDWAVTDKERSPFTLLSPTGVKFIIQDKENPLEFLKIF